MTDNEPAKPLKRRYGLQKKKLKQTTQPRLTPTPKLPSFGLLFDKLQDKIFFGRSCGEKRRKHIGRSRQPAKLRPRVHLYIYFYIRPCHIYIRPCHGTIKEKSKAHPGHTTGCLVRKGGGKSEINPLKKPAKGFFFWGKTERPIIKWWSFV